MSSLKAFGLNPYRPMFFLSLMIVGLLACTVGVVPVQAQKKKQLEATWDEAFIGDRYNFRWEFKVGQKLRVEVSQNSVTSAQGGLLKTAEEPISIYLVQEWLVEDRNDEVATILQTFKQLRVEFSSPAIGQVMADTNLPTPENLLSKRVYENLKKLVDVEVRMQVGPLGDVKKVEIVKKGEQSFQDALGAMFSPQQLENLFSQVGRFHSISMKAGDHWDKELKVTNANMPAQLTQEYTYEGPDPNNEDLALISIKPTLEITKENAPIEIDSQEASGQMQYSFSERLPLVTKFHQELILAVKPKQPEDPVRKQKVVTDTSVRLTVEKDVEEDGSDETESDSQVTDTSAVR